jgi:exonuclease III
MDLLFEDMKAADGAAAIFVFGDFNEPSENDWTDAAVAAGQQPVKVQWPTTHRLSEAGFVDTYRAFWPDPVAKPAYTWTARGDEGPGGSSRPDRLCVCKGRQPESALGRNCW